MRISRLILVLMAFLWLPAFSQVSIQFVPEVFGRSMDGLMNASIYSIKDRLTVQLNITVTEAKAGKVLTIQTQPFTIVPGNNILPPSAIKSSKVTISNTAMGNFVRQNSIFPNGDYDYSYVVISAQPNRDVIIDQNFSQEITPSAPLDLIEPFNNDQICEKRPMFTWQPSFPQIPGALYQLTLVEMKGTQNAIEALNYNLPVVDQKGILTNVLMYPPVAKELSTGKQYAWQVTIYKGQSIINRSEVWAFKLDCSDTLAVKADDDNGYRDIEDLAKGNFYLANGVVKFAVMNSYGEQDLKYSISCLSDPDQKVRFLPKKKLSKGKTKVNIDLRNNLSMKDGYSYLLTLELPSGTIKSLKFIYREL